MSKQKTEAGLHLATARAGHGQDAAVELLSNPALPEREMQNCRAERSAKMRTALAPIEAGVCKAAAEIARCVKIDAESGERTCAFGREAVGVFTRWVRSDPLQRGKAIMECDACRARDVVVAIEAR